MLEQLTRVGSVFFDKTGTLTVKQSRGCAHRAFYFELYGRRDSRCGRRGRIVLIHILALGIARAGKKVRAATLSVLNVDAVSHVSERSGYGVSAIVDGHEVRVGRRGFVEESADSAGFAKSGRLLKHDARLTALREADEMGAYVSIDGELVGRIVLRDVERSNARTTIERLRALGVRSISMLTGDGPVSANRVAASVGIAVEDVHANCCRSISRGSQ